MPSDWPFPDAEIRDRRVFMASPESGVLVHAAVYDASADGQRLLCVTSTVRGSDTVDVTALRVSRDGGQSWGEPRVLAEYAAVDGGTWRGHQTGYYYDARTDRLISLWNEAVLPNDRAMESLTRNRITYSISHDGGETETARRPLIQDGEGYDETHPIPGVWIGQNSFLRGDLGCRPMTRSDGAILVPAHITPLGPDVQLFNPHQVNKYRDSVLFIGHWQGDGSLRWESSERLVADPDRTTRGVLEPTIAQLDDGRILMVMRGSNAKLLDIPARRWYAISDDGGYRWTEPEPWRYDDGELFHSPSACSQLVPLQDGRLYWFGNICRENARANGPRYPFVMGQVDTRSGLLIRGSCRRIDDRAPGESPHLTLSNFLVRQEQSSGDLLLYMSRTFAQDFRADGRIDWTADALEYRLALP